MKFTTRKDYTGTIRKIWTDDKSKVLGIVGEIGDLLKEGILESYGGQYSFDTWMCIPVADFDTVTGFGATREEAVRNANFRK